MQTILSNISQVAAMAIIVAAVGGFFVAVVGSALGHPVNADALAMVNTLVEEDVTPLVVFMTRGESQTAHGEGKRDESAFAGIDRE